MARTSQGCGGCSDELSNMLYHFYRLGELWHRMLA
jgi:hypothetical protein